MQVPFKIDFFVYLSDMFQGWETGVIGMKKGGKRFLVVPPNLAYGSQGMGNKVPPNSTLLFEIEVVRVNITITLVSYLTFVPDEGFDQIYMLYDQRVHWAQYLGSCNLKF